MQLVYQEAFFGRPLLDKSELDGGMIEPTSDDNKSNPPSPAIKSTILTSDPFEFPLSPLKQKPRPKTPQLTSPTTQELSRPGQMTHPGHDLPMLSHGAIAKTSVNETHSDGIDDSDKEHQIGQC